MFIIPLLVLGLALTVTARYLSGKGSDAPWRRTFRNVLFSAGGSSLGLLLAVIAVALIGAPALLEGTLAALAIAALIIALLGGVAGHFIYKDPADRSRMTTLGRKVSTSAAGSLVGGTLATLIILYVIGSKKPATK